MSSQPPEGQGPGQQPPEGTPPEQGPPAQPPDPPPGGYVRGGLGGRPSNSRTVLIVGIVGAIVVVTGLAAVFSVNDEDAGGDYCGLLEDNGNVFADIVSGNVAASNFDEAVGNLHELREAAPDAVADEWAALDDPFQELQEAIDDVGITWGELLQTAPQDVDPEVRDAGEKFADDVGSIDVESINQTLNDHADEECGLDLENPLG